MSERRVTSFFLFHWDWERQICHLWSLFSMLFTPLYSSSTECCFSDFPPCLGPNLYVLLTSPLNWLLSHWGLMDAPRGEARFSAHQCFVVFSFFLSAQPLMKNIILILFNIQHFKKFWITSIFLGISSTILPEMDLISSPSSLYDPLLHSVMVFVKICGLIREPFPTTKIVSFSLLLFISYILLYFHSINSIRFFFYCMFSYIRIHTP